MSDYHLCIGPASGGKVEWEKASAPAAMRSSAHERGVRMVMKRNPNYWKAGHANFDEVELVSIPDPRRA